MKKCKRCNQEKPLSEYSNMKGCLHGKRPRCKKCRCEIELTHRRTKKGLLRTIYASQLQSSAHRGHPSPKYTLKELTEWVLEKPIFHLLYENWKRSGFEKMLRPSLDRLNDYEGYSFDNIRIVTWEENQSNGHRDRRNGINNKVSKGVIQLSADGTFIKEYYSMSQASRETGVKVCNISECIIGVRGNGRRALTAGGFIWKLSK